MALSPDGVYGYTGKEDEKVSEGFIITPIR